MYRIYNNRNKREKNKYIILTHARNMYELGTNLSNDVKLGGTKYYTWGAWQNYFYKILGKDDLPCHYFIELLDKDYVIYKGLNFINRSYFMEDLVQARAIPYRYKDSIVIAISENFELEPLDSRMILHLNDKVLSELIALYDIKRENILFLDSILLPGWKFNLEQHGMKYEIELQNFIAMSEIYTKLPRYDKGRVTFM